MYTQQNATKPGIQKFETIKVAKKSPHITVISVLLETDQKSFFSSYKYREHAFEYHILKIKVFNPV